MQHWNYDTQSNVHETDISESFWPWKYGYLEEAYEEEYHILSKQVIVSKPEIHPLYSNISGTINGKFFL